MGKRYNRSGKKSDSVQRTGIIGTRMQTYILNVHGPKITRLYNTHHVKWCYYEDSFCKVRVCVCGNSVMDSLFLLEGSFDTNQLVVDEKISVSRESGACLKRLKKWLSVITLMYRCSTEAFLQ